jgi:hypothetical protein
MVTNETSLSRPPKKNPKLIYKLKAVNTSLRRKQRSVLVVRNSKRSNAKSRVRNRENENRSYFLQKKTLTARRSASGKTEKRRRSRKSQGRLMWKLESSKFQSLVTESIMLLCIYHHDFI